MSEPGPPDDPGVVDEPEASLTPPALIAWSSSNSLPPPAPAEPAAPLPPPPSASPPSLGAPPPSAPWTASSPIRTATRTAEAMDRRTRFRARCDGAARGGGHGAVLHQHLSTAAGRLRLRRRHERRAATLMRSHGSVTNARGSSASYSSRTGLCEHGRVDERRPVLRRQRRRQRERRRHGQRAARRSRSPFPLPLIHEDGEWRVCFGRPVNSVRWPTRGWSSAGTRHRDR